MTLVSGPPPTPPSSRRWLAVSITSGIGAVAILIALVLYLSQPYPPQLFTASARIAIADGDSSQLRGALYEQAADASRLSEATQEALTTLGSRAFVEQVARDLGLIAPKPAPKSSGTNFFDTMAGATEDPKPDVQLESAVDAFRRNLSLEPRDGSTIEVSFTSPSGETAIRSANRVAEFFSQGRSANDKPAADPTTARLQSELTALESEAKQLAEGEASAQAQPVDDTAEQSANDEHEAARAETAAAAARLDRARDLVLAGEAYKLLDPSTSTLARYLVDGRESIQRLMSTQKDPDSARGQQLANDLAGIDRQISRQVQQITEKLQQNVEAARTREAEKAKALHDVQAHKGRTSSSTASLAKVRAAIKSKQAELQAAASGANSGGGTHIIRITPATTTTPVGSDSEAEAAQAVAVATGLITLLMGASVLSAWTYASGSRPASAPASEAAPADVDQNGLPPVHNPRRTASRIHSGRNLGSG